MKCLFWGAWDKLGKYSSLTCKVLPKFTKVEISLVKYMQISKTQTYTRCKYINVTVHYWDIKLALIYYLLFRIGIQQQVLQSALNGGVVLTEDLVKFFV